MEEKILVGYGYGRFKNDSGEMQDYCNAFVLEDFNGSENSDYHFAGQKAVKYRCINSDVWKNIPIGSKVQCYFDSKNRITLMIAVTDK